MTSPHAPLNGICVLDLSRILAGPWCAQLLGDLGAKVIKIESLEGDETRNWGPRVGDNESTYFLSANRNKEILNLNLKDKRDHSKFLELIKTADVIVENFKESSGKHLMVDYDSLAALNPRLIYASIRGFPPLFDSTEKPGFDVVIQAMSGLMSITGFPSTGPTKVGVAVSDILCGLYLSNGILAAILEREKSGYGQRIEINLLDAQVFSLANVLQQEMMGHSGLGLMGNDHPNIFPYGTFKTKDGLICLGIGSDSQFRDFCERVSSTWHFQKEFLTNRDRVTHRELLRSKMEETLQQKNVIEWLDVFKNSQFPFGPVQSVSKSVEQAKKRGWIHFDKGIPFFRNPLRFSRSQVLDPKRPKPWS